MNRLSKTSAMAAAAAVLTCASAARATFHEWAIDEVYSNASGSVQFVEFQLPPAPSDNESFLSIASLSDSALGHNFNFPTNLPSLPVGNQHFLVGTPGYAALSGVPTPDYVLPINDFFSTAGDTLTYTGITPPFSFSAGQLPTNGIQSLNRADGDPNITTAVNSPTNFAGKAGSVPEPGAMGLIASCAVLALRRRRS